MFELILDHVPPPRYHEGSPFQARVANLDSSPYLGRLALCRVHEGELRKGDTVAWWRADGSITNTRITELFVAEGLERVAADKVGPGDVIAIAGIQEIMIGETIADADDPHPLPVIKIDEPSLSMTLGTNTSPLAGRSGSKMTARMIKDRLDRELVGNVSLRVSDTERPDVWEVQGRGELQLGVLIELMRREGFELTVGKPQVVTREVDGTTCEPVERVTIDVPEDYSGTVIQALGGAQGPDGADDQPRQRLGQARLPDPGPRPARLPHRVPHRDARHRHPAPRVRALRAVARRDPRPSERLADRRSIAARRPPTR